MNATPFSFGHDFRAPAMPVGGARHQPTAGEDEAREQGRQAGFRQAEDSLQGRINNALERIGALVPTLLAELDGRSQALEAEALRVAFTLARTIAGDALAAHPLGAIASVAAEAFGHLRGVPHLVVRVHESLVEEVETMMGRMGRERGFEGRVVVLGEPDIAIGDARLEWADGGVARERARFDADVARIGAEFGLSDSSQRFA